MKHCQIKRFADKSICSYFVGFRTVFFLIFSGQQNYWDMADFQFSFHIFAELDTVHLRHHHIRDNQVDVFIL